MKTNPTLKTEDFTDQVNRAIKSFAGEAVLVGIPAADTTREKDEGEGPINNATLLALNEFGSPINNIPSRPVMTIGLRNAQEQIIEQLKKAAQTFFIEPKNTVYLERAGIIATNAIKKAINDQDSIDGPAASTLAARRARGFKGNKSLIVTGQMRNAITHVLTGLWSNVAALSKMRKK